MANHFYYCHKMSTKYFSLPDFWQSLDYHDYYYAYFCREEKEEEEERKLEETANQADDNE